MNARVKPAAFLPLFATTTTEGPANREALIEQMKAGGMMAGAWMVEDIVRRLAQFEELAGNTESEIFELAGIKGQMSELSYDLEDLAGKAENLSERLNMTLSPDELEAEAEEATTLAGAIRDLSTKADRLYNTLDA